MRHQSLSGKTYSYEKEWSSISDDIQKIIPIIKEAWVKGVKEDSRKGFLWNGETCVHCSLAYHLRKLLEKDENLTHIRIWHEVGVVYQSEDIESMEGFIDLVIVSIDEELMVGRQEEYAYFSSLPEESYGELVAIEVKYAAPYSSTANDFKKLLIMKGKGVLPVLAFLEGSDGGERKKLIAKCREMGVMLLYGIERADSAENDWKGYF